MSGYAPITTSANEIDQTPDSPSTAVNESFMLHNLSEKLQGVSHYDSSSSNIAGVSPASVPILQRTSQRRHRTYFLILLGISLLTAYQSYRPSTSSLATPHVLPPTFVAPRRRFAPDGKSLYTDCSVDEVLEALRTAVVREDGASRFPNFTKPTSVALPSFEWSFDFGALESGKTCKPLRYYDPQEACEAMSAFGGIYVTGDSFMRHYSNAINMLLRGRLDGAVTDYRENTLECAGELMYDDRWEGKHICMAKVWTDSNKQEPVCGGEAIVAYQESYFVDAIPFGAWPIWRQSLPTRQQRLSPVYITGIGAHFWYRDHNLTSTTGFSYLDTLFSTLSHNYPVPLNLWAGPHHPDDTKLQPAYQPVQGAAQVDAYRKVMPVLLDERSKEKDAAKGGVRYIDYFPMSDGASSYDGMHHSYQVNMEKVQILLNLLDIMWGDIVKNGGMVDV